MTTSYYPFCMAYLATFLGVDMHLVEFFDDGSDVELHGYAFSLIFLESLVYSFFSL